MEPIHILHVEDSEGDILLIRDAIEEGGIAHTLDVVRNGQEAMEFLNKTGNFTDKQTPNLILLDINMPVMNGHELLDFIKTDERFKHLPVIMLTTSGSQDDIFKAYQKYTNSYIVKPGNVNDFERVVRAIENFWITVAQLPKKP
ncbi:MAG: response regulator [Ferruginibacter sp.]